MPLVRPRRPSPRSWLSPSRASAAVIQDALSRLIFGVSDDVISTQQVIAGREVTRYEMTVEGGPVQTAYGLPSGEVAWFLVTDEGSLEEVIAALP